MTPENARRFGLLTALYLSQGLPFGFFTQALPVMMRQENHSLTAISLTGLLAFPWALKFLWAPYVDRFHSPRLGRRRSWLLPLQGFAIALMLFAAFTNASELPVLLALVFATNLAAATQDIASDGLAVDVLEPEQRGLGNGIQVGAYRLGMILGGGVLLLVFDDLGWSGIFFVIAGVLALCTLPVLVFKEASAPSSEALPTTDSARGHWDTLLALLRRPGMKAWAMVLILYKGPDALAASMTRPMLVDLGFDMSDIGFTVGIVGSVSSLIGALAGGLGVRRWGRRRALLSFGVLQAIGVACLGLPVLVDVGFAGIIGVIIIEGFLGSMATVALFTAMMDKCDPATGATDYTVQASIVVFATGIGSVAGGPIADAIHFAPHFLLTAVLTLVALWVIAKRLWPAVVETSKG